MDRNIIFLGRQSEMSPEVGCLRTLKGINLEVFFQKSTLKDSFSQYSPAKSTLKGLVVLV